MSQWYAIRSATRQEARAESGLRELGVSFYMPRETRWQRLERPRDGKDKVKIERPLWPGYIFGLLTDKQIPKVLAVDAVHNLVGFTNSRGERRPFPIPAAAVHKIQADEAAGTFDKTKRIGDEYRPAIGDQVRVTKGTFTGYLATVLELVGEGKKARIMLHGLGGGAMPLEVTHIMPEPKKAAA